jgi:hypothetical protein
VANTRSAGVALTLALLLLLVSAVPTAGRAVTAEEAALVASEAGWTHVGSGPLATSTRLTASVRYPAGILAGDLLLLSCQGERNAMRWSAPGFGSLSPYGDYGPFGPAGLRWVLLSGKATGGESGTVLTVRNTTGVNGWSCSITAMRGGTPRDANFRLSYFDWGNVQSTPPRDKVMVNSEDWDVEGWLLTHWFVSSDDNDHGAPSHGTLAFGGAAYDTAVGTDHAASMVWHVGATPTCWPPEECPPPPENPYEDIKVLQRANAPDSYLAFTVIFSPCWEAVEPGPVCSPG